MPKTRILRAPIRYALQERGCPHGDPEIVVAAMRAGLSRGWAMQLAHLADAIKSVDPTRLAERASIMQYHSETEHAAKYPNGKYAEELRARTEGRPSRWGQPGPDGHAALVREVECGRNKFRKELR